MSLLKPAPEADKPKKSDGIDVLLYLLFLPTADHGVESYERREYVKSEDDGEASRMNILATGNLFAWKTLQRFWGTARVSTDRKVVLSKWLGIRYYIWLMPTAI